MDTTSQKVVLASQSHLLSRNVTQKKIFMPAIDFLLTDGGQMTTIKKPNQREKPKQKSEKKCEKSFVCPALMI